MIRPRQYLIRMIASLAVMGAVVAALFSVVIPFFLVNPAFNGLIVGVILIGIVLNLRQVLMLGPEVAWIDRRARDEDAAVDAADPSPPRLLGPMATMLRENKGRGRFVLNAPAMRSLLDSIASRLDEARETSRYFVGLCIFLGLLGTFWGLLHVVSAVSEVVAGLELSGNADIAQVFSSLKKGLEAPMQGMGTAFSSSLFGLAGSLLLGFLDLQAGQAQNAFHNRLEEWITGMTRLTASAFSGGGDGGDPTVPAYIQALLEQTAENMEELQRAIVRGEESRAASASYQRDLAERLSTLTDQMRAEQQLLLKMAEHQMDLKNLLVRLSETAASPAPVSGIDDVSRAHIRNIDIALGQLVHELSQGREETVKNIRSDIKMLARTLAAAAEGNRG